MVCDQIDALSQQIEQALIVCQAALARGQAGVAYAIAEDALAVARAAELPEHEAAALARLGELSCALSEYERANSHFGQAVACYQGLGDQAGEARVLCLLGTMHRLTGATAQAREVIEQALALARALGDRRPEAEALSEAGHLSNDFAEQRAYYEQALAVREAIGDQAGLARSHNHLGLLYWQLGLYTRARSYLERAEQISRTANDSTGLAYCLESLGRVCYELGDWERATELLEEGRALAIAIGDRGAEAPYWLVLGRIELERGQPDVARDLIAVACTIQRELCLAPELATSLAWLGACYRSLSDAAQAEELSAEATDILAAIDNNSNEYPAQAVWWLRYQALRAGADRDTPPEAAAWECLCQAHALLARSLATIGDGGMRRHYLGRVAANQAIVRELARWSPVCGGAAGLALGEVGPPADRASDTLRRLLNISLRLNTIRDSQQLFREVVDQAAELIGAERAQLLLLDERGRQALAASHGPAEPGAEDVGRGALAEAAGSQRPVLLHEQPCEPASPSAALELRSLIVAPLVARARVIGLLAIDNRGLAGRFTPADVDLLMIFASQAAAALDNDWLYQQSIRAKQEIEQRVAERTAELKYARDAAEAASRAKSIFLANMSHELRTPLTAILGYADLLMIEAVEQNQLGCVADLTVIQKSGLHLLNLISNVLDLSKIESGKLEVEPSEVGVAELVHMVVGTILPLARERGNTVRLDCPEHLGTMYVDALKLRQALLNLLSNACKFTERGEIVVQVRREGAPGWLWFSVRDSGPGLPADQLDRLFVPFGQLSARAGQAQRGAGLGLALTRRFCRLMGGDVCVSSAPGRGACFTIRLPERYAEPGFVQS